MAQFDIGFHLFTQFEAVHHRHHDVADDNIDMMIAQDFQSRFSVGGRLRNKHLLQFLCQERTHGIVIFYQQECIVAAFRIDGCPFFGKYEFFLDNGVFLLPHFLLGKRQGQDKRIVAIFGIQPEFAGMKHGQRTCQW